MLMYTITYHSLTAILSGLLLHCNAYISFFLAFAFLYYRERSRVIIAFQEIDGFDVAFFILYAYEWIFEKKTENYAEIEYLDSVQYFQPKDLKTQVYQQIVIGYLKYAGDIG